LVADDAISFTEGDAFIYKIVDRFDAEQVTIFFIPQDVVLLC